MILLCVNALSIEMFACTNTESVSWTLYGRLSGLCRRARNRLAHCAGREKQRSAWLRRNVHQSDTADADLTQCALISAQCLPKGDGLVALFPVGKLNQVGW